MDHDVAPKTALMGLDCAIRLQTQDKMSLDRVLTLVGQLSHPIRVDDTNNDCWKDLSHVELQLLQFCHAAVPSLYTLEQTETTWILRTKQISGSRRNALQLHKNNEISSGPILQAIRDTRQSQRKPPPKPQKKQVFRAPIVTGDTVEERVRARAQQALANSILHAGDDTTPRKHSTQRRAEQLAISDALWTHARSILRYRHVQGRLHVAPQKGASNSAAMTLKDAVNLLTRTISTGKRKIVQDIHDTEETMKEWLRLDPPHGSGPNTTVWLTPEAYKENRWKLSGEEKPPASSTKALLSKDDEDKAMTVKHLSLEPRSDDPRPAKRRRPSPPLEDIKEDLKMPSPKRHKLRINPYLILNDADHQGGEVIPRSEFDSPRGLNRLFHRIAAGQRI